MIPDCNWFYEIYYTSGATKKWAKYGSKGRIEMGKLDLFSHVLVSQIEAKYQRHC